LNHHCKTTISKGPAYRCSANTIKCAVPLGLFVVLTHHQLDVPSSQCKQSEWVPGKFNGQQHMQAAACQVISSECELQFLTIGSFGLACQSHTSYTLRDHCCWHHTAWLARKQNLIAARQPSAGPEVYLHNSISCAAVLHQEVSRTARRRSNSLMEGFFSVQPICEKRLIHTCCHMLERPRFISLKT